MSEQRQMLYLEQALDLARQHHTAGRLSQAETIYQQILQSDPNQADALHLLGVIAHQVGRNDTAVDQITKALAINPELAEAHSNLGLALHELGKLEEAVTSYGKALVLKPDYVEANYNLGNVLEQLDRLEEAVTSYQKAVSIRPDYVEAHYNLGNALEAQGNLEGAMASYRRALVFKPDLVNVHNNLALVMQELGMLEEAEQTFRTALRLDPERMDPVHAKVLVNLADVIKDIAYCQCRTDQRESSGANCDKHSENTSLWDEVLFYANEALSLQPGYTAALALQAAALLGLDRYRDWKALCDFDRLLQTQTMSIPEGYADLGTFNEALFRRCANSGSKLFEPHGKSIQKGHRTNSLQRDSKTGPVGVLLEFVNNAAERYRTKHPVDPQHPYLAQQPVSWDIEAWGSILGRQGYHKPHIHPRGWLSGVYYGMLSDIMETENGKREGCIEFGRPKNQNDDANNPEFPFIRPHEGLMLLFPSYFYHQTIPFDSDGTRFSISFDFIPLTW